VRKTKHPKAPPPLSALRASSFCLWGPAEENGGPQVTVELGLLRALLRHWMDCMHSWSMWESYHNNVIMTKKISAIQIASQIEIFDTVNEVVHVNCLWAQIVTWSMCLNVRLPARKQPAEVVLIPCFLDEMVHLACCTQLNSVLQTGQLLSEAQKNTLSDFVHWLRALFYNPFHLSVNKDSHNSLTATFFVCFTISS